MKPLTIEDLQESSEEYKLHFNDRKLKFIEETEATEEEFVLRELELWDDCVHLLNFEKQYEETDWHSVDRQHVKVLVEGISKWGIDRVYHPSKRKLEYLETFKTSIKKAPPTVLVQPSPINHMNVIDKKLKTDGFDKALGVKSKKEKSSQYYLRSICIAIFCMGVTVDSLQGRKILLKYTGDASPPGLKNNVVSAHTEITSIAENPNQDKWRKIFIKEAKWLLTAEKKQKALQVLTQYQKTFQERLDAFIRSSTG